MPMFRPAANWLRIERKVVSMSPDQTRAPYFWLPAQAQRSRLITFSCPAALMPSKKARA